MLVVASLVATCAAVLGSAAPAAAYSDPSAMSDADFFAKLDLNRPGLESVKSQVAAGNYAGAKVNLLSYYRGRNSPVVPNIGSTPITSPLSSTADELTNYIFRFSDGQSRNFAGNIDWDYHWNPANPAEFGADHYYVVDFMMNFVLAPAYNALPAGDPRRTSYADTWIKFALEFIADKGNTNDGLGPEPGHLGSNRLDMAKRLSTWLDAFQTFKNDPVLDANALVAVLKYAWQMSDRLYNTIEGTSGNNWYMAIARSIFSTGVYFPEFKDAANWRMRGEGASYKYMTRNLKGDGFNVETTENYHEYGLSLANTVKKIGAMNGYDVLTGLGERLERGGEVLVDMSLPNLEMPQIGDSASVTPDYSKVLPDFADYYDREDFRYVGTKGGSGTVPTNGSVLYPNSFGVMRTGWSTNDNYLMVENSDTSYAGSHDHPDDLSLVMYAYGKRLLVDPGVYDYMDADPGNWLRDETEAHNTVTVDRAAHPYRRDRKHVTWQSNAGFDYYHGQHKDYDPIAHNRKIFFVKPGFWIVSDVMSGSSTSKTYEQLWHFPPTTVSVDPTTKRARTGFTGEANVKVIPADPTTVQANLRSGYYSPQMKQSSPATYLAYSKAATGATSFDTVLFPEQAGADQNVTVTRLSTGVAATTATALRIALASGNTGSYYLSHEANPVTRTFGSYGYNGQVSYVEKTAAGALVTASVVRGSSLTDGTTNLISSAQSISDLSVSWQGATLALSAKDLMTSPVTLYAPGVTAVTLNGAPVGYTRSGDFVTIAGATVPTVGTTALTDAFDIGGLTSQNWTFDDAAGATGFVPESGTWVVQAQGGSNAYRQSTVGQSSARTLTSSRWSDVLVEAKVTTTATTGSYTGVSLFGRYQDANHHLEFRYYTNGGSPQLQIVKRFVGASGPTETVLASAPYTMNLNTTYTMKAVLSGNVLKLFVNGTAYVTAYDTDLLIGAAGLGAHKRDAYFDDVKVTEVYDGDSWAVDQGYFLINNSELYSDSLTLDNSLIVTRRENDLTDVAGTARVKVAAWGTAPGRAGLTLRTLGGNDAYRFVVYNSGTARSLCIESVVSGQPGDAVPTTLACKPYTFNTGVYHTFTVVAKRGTLVFQVNGVPELTVHDPILSRGGMGLYASKAQVRFDDARLDTLS